MIRSRHVAAALVVCVGWAGQAAARQAAPKLVAPIYGEAKVEITKPATKVVGNELVTTVMVKNVEAAPIAGLQVDEYWYDAGGQPLGGGKFRNSKPLKPGEVILVTLRTTKTAKHSRNQLGFAHAHGAIKKTIVPKLVVTTAP